MHMTRGEYYYHMATNDSIWQCHQRKCAIRKFRFAVEQDLLKPMIPFAEATLKLADRFKELTKAMIRGKIK